MSLFVMLGLLFVAVLVVGLAVRRKGRRSPGLRPADEIAGLEQARREYLGRQAQVGRTTRDDAAAVNVVVSREISVIERSGGGVSVRQKKVLQILGGNQGAFERTFASYRRKYPQMSDEDILDKMIYDLGRKR